MKNPTMHVWPRSYFLIPFTTAVLFTLFLFFIDEGYYNFNWMKSFGNWVAFTIYILIFFICQLLVNAFLYKLSDSTLKHILVAIWGLTMGCILAWGFIFS